MKKLCTILATLFLITGVWAQSPQKINYQAVLRNSSNVVVSSKAIGMRISILQGTVTGTPVYKEIFNPNPETNATGVVTVEIGSGIPLSGSFASIDWAGGPYFVKIETDPTGGTNYTISSTSQLLSVPFALYATKVEGLDGKVDKVTGKDLSTNDFTTAEKTKLAGIATGAGVNVNADWNATTGDAQILNKPTIPSAADGSETKLTAGDNVTITGDGTAASPYVINRASGTAEGQMQYWNGSTWVNVAPGATGQVLTFNNGVPTWLGKGAGVNDVFNPVTGKIWMDRNLGATQIATSSTDVAAYGDLYQWGRPADGHQIRTSGTSSTLSNNWDWPGHSNFILVNSSPFDWRSPQNDDLWQGVSGINPCPTGYRLPTEAEWNAERLNWSSNNASGAFASPLKLPAAGLRHHNTGSLITGNTGYYWSSAVSVTSSRCLYFFDSSSNTGSGYRADGFSVRCLKD